VIIAVEALENNAADVTVITHQGVSLRTAAHTIPLVSRASKGVIVIKPGKKDRVVSMAVVEAQIVAPEEGEEAPPVEDLAAVEDVPEGDDVELNGELNEAAINEVGDLDNGADESADSEE